MKKIVAADSLIAICAVLGEFYTYFRVTEQPNRQIYFIVFAGVIILCLIDFYRILKKQKDQKIVTESVETVSQVTLLDEKNRPVKYWDLKGKTSLLIGRDTGKEPVDIDLGDTEYASLIEEQHAVLNYAAGNWYVEDLYSKNGIRIQKQIDGTFYRIAKDRPCRLCRGDILKVANTSLEIR